MSSDFVHLHVHSEYSLLDGACRLKDLCAQAARLGMKSLAITDHGVMFGAVEFYKEAKKHAIKPIIGCEVYVAARSRHDKTPGQDARSSHLVLLAKNDEGYKNLTRMVSAGFTEGYYYRPRVDFELLERYSAGLVALSACLSGDVPEALAAGDEALASRLALRYKGIFGRDYYLEMQDSGFADQKTVNSGLIRLARKHDIGLVATNDVHYIAREDARAQDVLMCIQTGKTVSDDDRMQMPTTELYLKSGDEMAEQFKNFPEALANTARIADMCSVDFEFGKTRLPKFKLPEGAEDAFSYLKELSRGRLAERFDGNVSEEAAARLEYELSVIGQMGYEDYFLIVWDFIRFARESGIPVGPGRGSAAGSLVSYALGITNIDPIRYSLFFERFLNPERISMPDIDIDFCYERRQEVIDYVIDKYGADHVAQIITFGTMAARAVIRDVGRALNIPYAEVDRIAKLIPMQIGVTIERALETSPELALMYAEDKAVAELIDMAKKLEGMPRHASTHAAGVLITDRPVTEYVPLQKNDECITTQFPMLQIEELGLLKIDFLGLRTLTVIHDTVEAVREGRGVELDMDAINLDDPGVYKMIGDGDTVAVFQLESSGMTQLMKDMQPGGIEDLSAGGALFRPGPMESIPRYIASKRNHDKVRYDHPMLEPILNVSYGCIVYQEQVLQIVRELAGYSYAQADMLRRAMSKKNHAIMENERQNFIYGATDGDGNVIVRGAVRNGVPEAVANKLFDEMSDFAGYGFNKSHSAAYALLIYQTAWLKYYYPVEFMAATLNSCVGFSDKVAHYIEQCRQSGVSVLPPDVNRSQSKFSVVEGSLRFGLAAIKNIGNSGVEAIIDDRRARGAYRSFTDFLRRVGASELNKRGIDSLIRCGAFDTLMLTRSSLLASYERLLDGIINSRRNEMEGQITFLGIGLDGGAGAGTAGAAGAGVEVVGVGTGSAGAWAGSSDDMEGSIAKMPEFPQSVLLNMEKEILGLYVSGHPLDGFISAIAKLVNCDTRDFRQAEGDSGGGGGDGGGSSGGGGGEAGPRRLEDGQNAIIGGIITRVKTKFTKSNALMAFVDLEDIYGSVEILVFPKIYERLEKQLRTEAIVLVKGKISSREDEDAKFLCDDVAEIDASLRNQDAHSTSDVHKTSAAQGVSDAHSADESHNNASNEYARLRQWAASRYGGYDRRNGAYATNGGQYPGGDSVMGMHKHTAGSQNNDSRGSNSGGDNGEMTLFIRIDGSEPKQQMDSAYATMKYFAGRTPVVLYNSAKKAKKDLGREYWVKITDTLLDEMRERFGADNVAMR
ncbi:MAG: DNA polymerase III subunit alpha [Oscillospiraceae bacterium]|nr:DNA polymerase III subunit alpha [Oscillospiraceae bacterium]